MNTNSKVAKLKAAHDQHVSAQAALEKIQAAVSGKSVPSPDRSAIESARLNLEDCLARRALDEATEAEEGQARAAFENAVQAFDASQKAQASESSELVGLNRRLLAAQKDEATTNQALSEAENDWLLEELHIADEAYTEQATKINSNYARVEACVAALKKRTGQEPNNFSCSMDLLIPTIGPVSCAAALKEMSPHEAHSIGKLLVSAGRRQMHKIKNDDVERDLLAVTANNVDPKIGRFAKMVGGLR